mgnify:CR=1 FL=1
MYISVKEFGEKRDGITDDTQTFYDCISFALENNKSVYLPKGTYILTVETSNNTITKKILVK